jgi:hypothetical protein
MARVDLRSNSRRYNKVTSLITHILSPKTIMSSELQNILEQAQKLDPQEQIQLISHLGNRVKSKYNNPWLATAGSLVDDPFFDDYIAEIERYRKELDSISLESEENSAA